MDYPRFSPLKRCSIGLLAGTGYSCTLPRERNLPPRATFSGPPANDGAPPLGGGRLRWNRRARGIARAIPRRDARVVAGHHLETMRPPFGRDSPFRNVIDHPQKAIDHLLTVIDHLRKVTDHLPKVIDHLRIIRRPRSERRRSPSDGHRSPSGRHRPASDHRAITLGGPSVTFGRSSITFERSSTTFGGHRSPLERHPITKGRSQI